MKVQIGSQYTPPETNIADMVLRNRQSGTHYIGLHVQKLPNKPSAYNSDLIGFATFAAGLSWFAAAAGFAIVGPYWMTLQ